jgi:two-component system chemotaxis sensor kinase CheA
MSELLDDDLILDYLAECREHLATIEADLLAIEQAGDAADPDLVNRVFRAAHSIKGGAGFFDLNTIRELAHKAENVLELIRSHQMAPAPDVVSVLLLAFDRLRTLLENHAESNAADISEFVTALTDITNGNLPPGQNAAATQQTVALPLAGQTIQVSAFDLNQASRAEKQLYLVCFDLIRDVQRRGETPLAVFRRLMDHGSILETIFNLDLAGTLEDEPASRLPMNVVFATTLSAEALAAAMQLSPEQVQPVENRGALSSLAAAVENPQIIPSAAPAPTAPAARPAPVQADATIRLNVSLLDSLMTLAGELVLSRNQLNESLDRRNERGIRSSAQRVSLVTSELQEIVTQTRMQPIGALFSRFPRLVRDLARDLGKEVQIKIEGGDVEIDKTILEGLADPLTHMIRNAVDHGIETRAQRAAAGKPEAGTVVLMASHHAGQVVIELADDGKGLAVDRVAAACLAKGLITQEQLDAMPEKERLALIFMPGVSTATKVNGVSGRGVGMDVVRTNLDKLGGKIEIETEAGKGTRFRIKLPLTLAIIPSLLVSDSSARFAIPQVNVAELIRIPATQIAARTNRVGDGEVLMLRDRLVPLLYLSDALGVPRSQNASKALNVVLVNTGALEYGLVIEQLHETVEIVVKPLGRHLKSLSEYAGATILGDGKVALILDVAELGVRSGMTSGRQQTVQSSHTEETPASGELQSLLVFHNAPGECCAVPVEQISRIERVSPDQVMSLGGRRTMQYRGANLPLCALRDTAAVGELSCDQQWVVIVFEHCGPPFGLLAAEPLDMREVALTIDKVTLRQRGIGGSAILDGKTVLLLDVLELAGRDEMPSSVNVAEPEVAGKTVLLAEDSEFFREQLRRLLEATGCRVLPAVDGQAAWEVLDRHADEVDAIATDIEMPRMDGLSLTRKLRADARFAELPVIMLSSLASEEDIARGVAAGATEYQVKLDRDQLLASLRRLMANAQRETRK